MASMPYSAGLGVLSGVLFSVCSRGSLLDFSQRFWVLRAPGGIPEPGAASNGETGSEGVETTQESSGETAPSETAKKSVSGPARGSISRRSVEVRKAWAGSPAT